MRSGRILPGVVLATALLCGCERHFDPRPIPPPPPWDPEPQNPSELIQLLEYTYESRDYDRFASLFPDDSETPFRFIPCEPLPGGEQYLDLTEFLRIHRRMFNPENPLPGETPVPQELWLVAITITLTPLTDWEERRDLYRSGSDSTGLDPARWRAVEAEYEADVLWDTQTDTDYRVRGGQSFVVIEDLWLGEGAERKFLLYRWEDLCTPARTLANERTTWSGVLGLYR